jgi:hypothetical protein
MIVFLGIEVPSRHGQTWRYDLQYKYTQQNDIQHNDA